MHADLDLLCISVSVYCTADDLLPVPRRNARRRLSDAEIVTLCVAQVLMGIPSDRRFLRAARRQLGRLFPLLPTQVALHRPGVPQIGRWGPPMRALRAPLRVPRKRDPGHFSRPAPSRRAACRTSMSWHAGTPAAAGATSSRG